MNRLTPEILADIFRLNFAPNILMQKLDILIDSHSDEQVEACVAALTKELELHTPKDRMRHIVDVCRDASLTKRGR